MGVPRSDVPEFVLSGVIEQDIDYGSFGGCNDDIFYPLFPLVSAPVPPTSFIRT